MTPHEYNKRNIKLQSDLITEAWENPPQSQRDKDIFNLKYILYGIGHGSRQYRSDCVSTLQRAIKRLEGIDLEEKEKAQASPKQKAVSASACSAPCG